jgi:hypothetical protein
MTTETKARQIIFKCRGKNLTPLQVAKIGIPNSRLVAEFSGNNSFDNYDYAIEVSTIEFSYGALYMTAEVQRRLGRTAYSDSSYREWIPINSMFQQVANRSTLQKFIVDTFGENVEVTIE